MANNQVQDGRTISHELTADCASGDVIVKGILIGIAVTAGKSGDTIALALTGVWSLPKRAAATITDGAALTWDVSAGEIGPALLEAGDVIGFGAAIGAPATNATSVNVLLTPGSGSVQPSGG